MMHGPSGRGGSTVADRGGKAGPRFSLRTFESLKIRNFRFYMGSSLAQMAAMNMQMTASGWFMYELTGSYALLGLTALASAIPQLVLSFGGGVIADRVSKKIILILGLLASMLVALWIALSTDLGFITWHYLILASFFQGTIMSLMMPARQSVIPQLVGRDNLMNAVALNMTGMNINRLGAPALAGFLIKFVGVEGVYYLMGALYFAAIILMFPLRVNGPGSQPAWSRRLVVRDIADGLAYVRGNADVRSVLILTLLTVFFSMPYFFLLPGFTTDVLKVGPEGLGLLMSASGVGALAGSLGIASMTAKRRGILYLHTVLVTGVGLVAFAMTTSYAIALAFMVIVGLGQAGRMALSNILLQAYTEDAYLGRVMSINMMEWGLTSLGAFGVSVAAEYIGAQWAIGVTAALLLVTAFYYYAFSPRIRRLD